MKTIVLLIFLTSLVVAADTPPVTRDRLKYPTTQDPQKFPEEVETFLAELDKQEFSIIANESEFMRKRIRKDSRDWESALIPIIGSPEKYGPYLPDTALSIAVHREGYSQNSELASAAVKLFHYRKDRALKEHDAEQSSENDRGDGRSSMGGTIAEFIRRVRLPETLQEVLLYFNSEAEEKLNLIDSYIPNEVAESLRSYGDERHIEGAKKFALKLRDRGKSDIADDIDRSVERILKDSKRAQVTPPQELPTAGMAKERNQPTAEEQNRLPLPWIIGGVVALLAIGGVLAMKSRTR
jgi:hypothetical protein